MTDTAQILLTLSILVNLALVFLTLGTIERNRKLKAKNDTLSASQKDIIESEKILDTAKEESISLLSHAADEAEDVLKQAADVGEDIKQKLSSQFEEIAIETKETLGDELTRGVKDFRVSLNTKLDEEFEGAKKEIEEYKQAEMKRADERLTKLLAPVAQEILGRSITPSEHQDLITKALEELKNDNT